MPRFTYHAAIPILALAGFLSACTVGPDFLEPPAPATRNFTTGGDQIKTEDQHVVPGQKVSAEWWKAFQSPQLDDVMQKALDGNNTLAGAKATLAQAQEQINAAAGSLWPQLSFGGTVGRQKYGKSLFGPSDITIPPFTYYTVGPQVSYLLDLAGGERRGVEQDEALAQFQSYETDAVRLSLTGNVVAQALGIASAKAQIAAIQQIIADDRRNVDLVEKARAAGSGTLTDVLSAQSQLAADQTLLPPMEQQLSVATHALSILTGKAPADWQPPDFTFAQLHLPSELPLSLPSELVRERPDIMAAEAQLHAASAAIGVATANLYPSINLSANVTQQMLTPGNLFNPAANAWALMAGLTAPIFSGGTLEAEKRGAEDAWQAALANYQQTVLQSFGQVADVLKALEHDGQQIKAQQYALKTAQSSLKLARTSYKEGNIGILQVLDAERDYNEAQLAMARVQAQRYQDTALLYLALGGGSLPPQHAELSPSP
jgi:NodT family efflux transporter outer membrane factor (OMF) lipoprotein